MYKLLTSFALFLCSSHSFAQFYDGKENSWELLLSGYLSVEDVYYDSIRFNNDNNDGELQYYVWVLHVYDRRRGIEHFNDNFEVVYVDDINAHQSVLNLTIIECEAGKYADLLTEYYYDAFPKGRALLIENNEHNLVTLPILPNDPFDIFCKRVS
jgi:hypothetical protein